MKRKPCTTEDCEGQAGPRTFWCVNCRSSLYRWMRMSPAQREASYHRAALRMGRVVLFTKYRKRKSA